MRAGTATRRAATLVLLMACFAGTAGAQTRFPAFTAPVVDAAGIVPDAAEQRINADLEAYRRRSGNQIAVAVVKTTGARPLEDYSIDLAREWGVGTKTKDNGVLLLIAYSERKLRIEVGRGLEGDLTDLESGRIIRDVIVPQLRRGDVGAAIENGTRAIRQAIGDPTVPTPQSGRTPNPSATGVNVIAPLLAFAGIGGWMLLGRRRRRDVVHRPGRMAAGRRWSYYGATTGGWTSGGASSNGGFGGGGGGGFGGGGASGSW